MHEDDEAYSLLSHWQPYGATVLNELGKLTTR